MTDINTPTSDTAETGTTETASVDTVNTDTVNTDTTATESVDEQSGEESSTTTATKTKRAKRVTKLKNNSRLRRISAHRTRIAAVTLAVLIVAAGVLTTVVYFTQYRPDKAIDADESRAATTAAQSGAVAVLSYAPNTMQRDFDNAKARLTGDFLDYYSNFTSTVVAPAVREKSVSTKATVVRTGITSLSKSSATALVFVNQSVTSSDSPDPNMTSSSVKVGMTKIDGKWKIKSFDPV